MFPQFPSCYYMPLMCYMRDLKFLVTFSYFCTCKTTTATGGQPNCSLLIVLKILLVGINPLKPNDIYRCHSRNGPNFGRVFLMLNYTDITQNTYVYPKLNGYGDNGQRKVWTSCISAYCTSTAV